MAQIASGSVRYVDRIDGGRMKVTVTKRETHNHRDFYRVKEVEGALFLAASLHRESGDVMENTAKERYVRVKNFPTQGGRMMVNGDIGVVLREYVEPASEWSGKPEIAMIVAGNAKWPGMELHLQPHQYDELDESAALHELVARDIPTIQVSVGDGTITVADPHIEEFPAQPEPRTVEEALALVTGGPDDYCDPKDQPEPERGTESDVRLEDLVMLLRRAVVRFRAIDDHKGNVLADSIMDYLRRKGLADGSSILRDTPPPLPVREQTPAADELLAEVMHLWIDGYISKNPNSCADASISNETFAKISAHLDNVGIEVDYCGWSRKAGEKEE